MKKYNKILLIILIALLSLLFLVRRNAFGLFESNVTGTSDVKVAKWDILLDGKHLNSSESIRIDSYNFENDVHVSDGYIAPGSRGTFDLVIDPNGTEVAIKYTITITDHTLNPDYLLTVRSVSYETNQLIKTGESEYTGIITLDEIEDEETKTVTLEVEWINDETNNEEDSLIGVRKKEAMFIDLDLYAVQYMGEEIIPYSGG